jgi:hypothetical protein
VPSSGHDHRNPEQQGAGYPGRAQLVAQQQDREDGRGERLEQRKQRTGTGIRCPQSPEVQRVGDRGRSGAQRDDQPDDVGMQRDADAAGEPSGHHQHPSAAQEPEADGAQIIKFCHGPLTEQRERGEPTRRQHRQASTGQHRALPVTARRHAD